MNEKQMAARIRVMWEFQARLIEEMVADGRLTVENLTGALGQTENHFAREHDSEAVLLVEFLIDRLRPTFDPQVKKLSDITGKAIEDAQRLKDTFGE